MTTTARAIITRALQKIGAVVKSEPPSADEANDALNSLNAMMASWSNDTLNIYAHTWETFSLVGGTGSYTIGSSGVFNTVRPNDILQAYIRIGSVDYPVGIVNDQAYNSVSFKSLTGIPEFLNYDNAYPLGTIRLYPVPSAAYSLFLLSEKSVTTFATLDTTMSLPDGWERALIYNLAMELAPEYSQPPDESVVKIAMESLGLIRIATAKVRGMDAFPTKLSVQNIYSGYFIS